MPRLALENLTLRGRLEDASLDVASGEHVLIAGASGAGKTTLLRLVAGLEKPTGGRLRLDGRDATSDPPHLRSVAILAQRAALYSHLSVERNLTATIDLKRPWWQRRQPLTGDSRLRFDQAVDRLRLGKLLERKPHQLSGGEQQRVALGRVWIGGATLWLLDEPFAHLDAALRYQVRDETLRLAALAGATLLEVTHDPVEARGHGGRVAVIHRGRIDQVGPAAEVYADPRTRAAADALADIPGNVAEGVWRPGGLTIAPGLTLPAQGFPGVDGQPLLIFVRPEHILTAERSEGALPLGSWTVSRAAPRGPAWLVTVERSGLVWRIWRLDSGPPTGATLSLAVPAEASFAFDAATGQRLGPVGRFP